MGCLRGEPAACRGGERRSGRGHAEDRRGGAPQVAAWERRVVAARSRAELRPVWRAYQITVLPVAGDIVHSTAIYLIDRTVTTRRLPASVRACAARGRPARPCGSVALAGGNRHLQAVLGRSQRADPPRVVRARRVVGEIEVEDGSARLLAEVRSLHRVEQIPAGAVGLAAARGIGERQEDAPAVALEPEEVETLGSPPTRMSRAQTGGTRTGARRRSRSRAAWVGPRDRRDDAERRVVVEVGEALKTSGPPRQRRLRMRSEELVACLTPRDQPSLGSGSARTAA